MERLRFGKNAQMALLGGSLAVLTLAVFAEEATVAGLSLFQQVSGSYLMMFVDRLSMTFLCL